MKLSMIKIRIKINNDIQISTLFFVLIYRSSCAFAEAKFCAIIRECLKKMFTTKNLTLDITKRGTTINHLNNWYFLLRNTVEKLSSLTCINILRWSKKNILLTDFII